VSSVSRTLASLHHHARIARKENKITTYASYRPETKEKVKERETMRRRKE
jgi:hypothetical protein